MSTAILYQNDSTNEVLFQLLSSTDHLTAITGKSASVTVQQRKKGGTWTTPLSTISEVGYGWYKYTGNAGDFDTLGTLNVRAYDTGTDVAEYVYEIQVASIAAATKTVVDAIKAKTDNLPSDPADESNTQAAFTTVNNTLATIVGYIDTEVAAILAKVNNLPSDPADASDIATLFGSVNTTLASIQTALTTLSGYVDTEVASILSKVNALPSDPADASDIAAAFSALTTLANAIKAKTDNLPNDPGDASDIAAAIAAVNSLTTAIKTKTDNLPLAPAAVGSPMTLEDNSIKDTTFDDSSLPVVGGGYGKIGTITWPYIVKNPDGTRLLEGVEVWISSDVEGLNRSDSKESDSLGKVVFKLTPPTSAEVVENPDAGKVYVWRQSTVWEFSNPDVEELDPVD